VQARYDGALELAPAPTANDGGDGDEAGHGEPRRHLDGGGSGSGDPIADAQAAMRKKHADAWKAKA
jgi:hypothetical protein